MKYIFLLLLVPLWVDAQVGYVSSPTNTPSNLQAIQRTGNHNKWVPFPSGGGDATNIFLMAGTNIFVTTNAQFVWTVSTTPDLWTNSGTKDIVNTNWYQNVLVVATTLAVTNGGSIGGNQTLLSVINTNGSKWTIKAIGDVVGGPQQKVLQYLDGGTEVLTMVNDGDITKLRGVNMHWPTTNGGAGQVLAQDGANPQIWYYTNLPVVTPHVWTNNTAVSGVYPVISSNLLFIRTTDGSLRTGAASTNTPLTSTFYPLLALDYTTNHQTTPSQYEWGANLGLIFDVSASVWTEIFQAGFAKTNGSVGTTFGLQANGEVVNGLIELDTYSDAVSPSTLNYSKITFDPGTGLGPLNFIAKPNSVEMDALGVAYLLPSTNASNGQVLAMAQPSTQLYWTNLPAGGITGGTTNFATTNSNTGLTNAIQSIYTNTIPNFIHGRSNYIAYFNPNTNEVSASIMFQTNGTKSIGIRNGDTPNGTLAVDLDIFGNYGSETTWDSLAMGWSVGNGDYYVGSSKAGSGTTRRLGITIGGTEVWNFSTGGHLLPNVNNASDIGASSDGLRNLYIEGTIFSEQTLTLDTPTLRNSSGASIALNGTDIYLGTITPAASLKISSGHGAPGPFVSCGSSALAFGTDTDSPNAFMRANTAKTAGLIQMGTNSPYAKMGTNQILTGSGGAGTDASGSDLTLAGGPATGAGTNGSFRVRTAQKGVSGTFVNTNADRMIIASEAVNLTTNAANVIATLTLPTSLKHMGVQVLATTTITDGTEQAVITEGFVWSALNKATTVTTSVSASTGLTNFLATGAATLTNTWTCTVASQTISLNVKPVTGGINATTSTCEFQLFINSNDGARVVSPVPN